METRIRTMVVGLAELEEVDPHLGPAIALAEALGAELHVVHAFHLPDAVPYPYPDVSIFSPELMQQHYDRVQEKLEARVREISGSDRIRCRAVPVPADLAVLDAAEEVDADLVLVGATRRGAIARAILGTTAQRIARGATMPVLVMRRPGPERPRRVLVATDLSDISVAVAERGLEFVSALAAPGEPELRFLLVISYDLPISAPLDQTRIEELGRERLDHYLSRTLPAGRHAERSVRRGAPGEEIAAEAERWGADVVIIGTHGRRGPSRFLIGSVAESVLRHATCDVLVIPTAAVVAEATDPAAEDAHATREA